MPDGAMFLGAIVRSVNGASLRKFSGIRRIKKIQSVQFK